MIPEKQQHGVDVPVLLPSDNAASRLYIVKCNTGESSSCSATECSRPTFQTLATVNYCRSHFLRLSISDILSRLNLDPYAPIGVARYSHPAGSEWASEFAWLRCDRDACGATYIERYDPIPLCKYCLQAAGMDGER